MIWIARARVVIAGRRVADQRGVALMAALAVVGVTSLLVTALLGMLFVSLRITSDQKDAALEALALDAAVETALNQMSLGDGALTPEEFCAPDFEGRTKTVSFSPTDFGVAVDGAATPITVDLDCQRTTAGATADQVRLVGATGYQGPTNWQGFPWASITDGPPDLTGVQPNLIHRGDEALRFDTGVTVRNGSAVLRNNAARSPAVSTAGEFLQGGIGPNAASTGDPCGLLAGLGGRLVNSSGAPSPSGEPSQAGRILDLDGVPTCGSGDALDDDFSPTDAVAGFAVSNDFGMLPSQQAPDQNACGDSPRVIAIEPGRYSGTQVARLHNIIDSVGRGRAVCNRATVWFKPGIFYFDPPARSCGSGCVDYPLTFNSNAAYFVFGEPLGWSLPGGVGVEPGAHLKPEAPLCDASKSGTSIVLAPHTKLEHVKGRLAICPAFSPTGDPYPAIYQETSVPVSVSTQLVDQPVDLTFNSPCPAADLLQTDNGRCPRTRSYDAAVSAPSGIGISSARVLITGHQKSRYSRGQSAPSDDEDTIRPDDPNRPVDRRETRIEIRNANNSLFCHTNAQTDTSWQSGMPTGDVDGSHVTSFNLKTGTCAAALADTSAFEGRTLRIYHRLRWSVGPVENPFLFAWLDSQGLLRQRYQVENVRVVLNNEFGVVRDDPPGPGARTAEQKVSPSAGPGDPLPHPASAPSGFVDSASVLTEAGAATPFMGNCDKLLCRRSIPGLTPTSVFKHQIKVEDIEIDVPQHFADKGIDPNLSDARVVLSLDPSGEIPDDLSTVIPLLWLIEELNLEPFKTLINSRATWSWFAREMTTKVVVDTPSSGTLCFTKKGPISSIQDVSFDLLDINSLDPSCNGVVERYSDLDGSDVTVTFEMPCLRNPTAPGQCLRTQQVMLVPPFLGPLEDPMQIRPPDVRRVQLAVNSDSYSGDRPKSQVVIDARTSPGNSSGGAPYAQMFNPGNDRINYGATFNVLGKVWMPLHDLDIKWNGMVTALPDQGIERPLFSGDLVLGSLASTMAAGATTGLVCCDLQRPETAAVDVRASIDGEHRLVASVNLKVGEGGGGPPRLKAEVIDWKDCRRVNCVFRDEDIETPD